MRAVKIVRYALFWNLLVGGALLFGGLMMVVLPAAQLDAVLTPEELRDPVIRESTQTRLLRLWGTSYIPLVGAGIATVVGSAIGLAALQQIERRTRVCKPKTDES